MTKVYVCFYEKVWTKEEYESKKPGFNEKNILIDVKAHKEGYRENIFLGITSSIEKGKWNCEEWVKSTFNKGVMVKWDDTQQVKDRNVVFGDIEIPDTNMVFFLAEMEVNRSF